MVKSCHRPVKTITCRDCGVQVPYQVGRPPLCCVPCAKRRLGRGRVRGKRAKIPQSFDPGDESDWEAVWGPAPIAVALSGKTWF